MTNPSEQSGRDTPPSPLPPYESPLMLRAVELATSYVGTEESPDGSNRGLLVDAWVRGHEGRFGYLVPRLDSVKGVPWCARFAADMISQAARDLEVFDPLRGAGDLASAYKWRRWAKSSGRLRTDAAPGYVGLLLHSDQSGHVVMCRQVRGDYVETVEGNARGAVRVLLRPTESFAAWVRVE